jgi:tripartite-type tricarboxylate transporter receptor subunit TctC
MRSFRATRAVLAFMATLGAADVHAQKSDSFPEQPVRLLVSTPPGGAVDLIGRALAKGLSEQWRQQVIVDNKTGASGLISAGTVAKAPPNGHTLALAGDTTLVVTPFLQKDMPYDTLTDLVPVALVAETPLMLVASATLKVKSLHELVAAARNRPGGIDYGSGGIGSIQHVSMELLQRSAGMSLHHIPYKGAAPALQDVLSGRVATMFVAVSTALPFITDGKLAVLGIGTPKRSPLLPSVPTIAEQGHPGFESVAWIGMVAPRGTPPALVDRISRDVDTVSRTAAYRDLLGSRGSEVRSSTPREFADRIRAEYERNRTVIRGAGIKPE